MAKKKTASRKTGGGGRRGPSITAADTRGKSLVIVESPAKARTINRYLGDDYVVTASMGHVRDLPQRDFGVDLEHDFSPTYTTVQGRSRVVGTLKKMADDAETVYLATDLDREGEAIAWHLKEAMDVADKKARRVVFNQITKAAIQQAFRQPHELDMDKVNAQQARRILDRIVGYQVSPLLWRKVKRGLSAGRVQTVAVRLIVEREREIRAFVPEEYWRIGVELNPDSADVAEAAGRKLADLLAGGDPEKGVPKQDLFAFYEANRLLRTELVEMDGEKFRPNLLPDGTLGFPASAVASSTATSDANKPTSAKNPYLTMPIESVRKDSANGVAAATIALKQREESPDDAISDPSVDELGQRLQQTAKALEQASYSVVELKTTTRQDKPAPPFTTAALQQAAVNQLGMSASAAMRLAQQLYEGIELEDEGSVGLITYMRTDSMNLAPEAVSAARQFVTDRFGSDFVPEQPNRYAASAGAQEAHEAIRPTDVNRTPESLRGVLDQRQWRLYDLIWRRFVACQMSPARWEVVTVNVKADCPGDRTGLLRASARKLVFEGHLAVTGRRETPEPVLPDGIEEGSVMWPARVEPTQHFTEPPPRYSEATLVKALESEGIGRPSTYAAIIDTIQQRSYVELLEKRFHPTAMGEVVTDMLLAAFPKIFDVEFTRFMESELDKIEESHADWVHVLREFYEPFSERLAQADEKMIKPVVPSDHDCPKCGKKLLYRIGRAGRFLGCEGYPDCDFTANIDDQGNPIEPKEVDVECPKCKSPMQVKRSRRGAFLGCTRYPDCDGTLPCDEEGNPLKVVEPDEIEMSCPDCGSPMKVRFARGGRSFMGCTKYPKCKGMANLPEGVTVRKPAPLETGIKCDKCDSPMVVRSGSKGQFLACSAFPKCRNAKNLNAAQKEAIAKGKFLDGSLMDDAGSEKKTTKKKTAARKKKADEKAEADESATASAETPDVGGELGDVMKQGCPECSGPMNIKTSRFGPFLGCANYPRCKGTVRIKGDALKQARRQLGLPETPKKKAPPKKTSVTCSQCGKHMVIREGRSGKFLGCSGYPKCRNTAPLPVELMKSADEGDTGE